MPITSRRVWTTSLLGVVGLLTVSLIVVKRLDEDNRFCVSCHLHEDLSRKTHARPATTLAAAHFNAEPDSRLGRVTARERGAAPPERCFTCHSGEGVVGWTQVTLLSAWDAGRWVLGDRHEPTHMKLPLTNEACTKCHAADIRGDMTEDETSSYHGLARHNSVTMACVSCHEVHTQTEAKNRFLRRETVAARCATCHRDLESS